MKRVVLLFPDLYLLWSFCQAASLVHLDINTKTKTLICDCSSEELTEAITYYRAKVLEEKSSLGKHSSL